MTSELQIRANQQNAQASTGPKSEEGKRRAALNSTTHGLTAKPVLVHDEDAQAFEDMRMALLRAQKPVGDLEMLYADRAAIALWRLNRVLALEGRLLLSRENLADGESAAQAFERDVTLINKGLPGLSAYEARIEGTFNANISRLKAEQQERAKREIMERGGYVKDAPRFPSLGPWAEVSSAAIPSSEQKK